MSGPDLYRVTVQVQAWQVTDDTYHQVAEWCGGTVVWDVGGAQETTLVMINTPGGQLQADRGDWVIKGVTGEFFTRSRNDFEQTYQAVDHDG